MSICHLPSTTAGLIPHKPLTAADCGASRGPGMWQPSIRSENGSNYKQSRSTSALRRDSIFVVRVLTVHTKISTECKNIKLEKSEFKKRNERISQKRDFFGCSVCWIIIAQLTFLVTSHRSADIDGGSQEPSFSIIHKYVSIHHQILEGYDCMIDYPWFWLNIGNISILCFACVLGLS